MPTNRVALERLGDTALELAEGARDIRHMRALDADGIEMGTVSELYVDTTDRTVRFFLVRGAGLLGLADRELLIPIEAIRSVNDAVRLRHSRLHVAQAPAFQPDLVDKRWYWEGMYGWYGYAPIWGSPIGSAHVRPIERKRGHNDTESS